MHDPEGRAFGDIFWAKIAVSGTDLACTLIEHTSFPDGSTLLPKQSFEKKWWVKTGAKAWPAGCLLKHVGGHGMGTKRPKFQPTPLPALSAGTEMEISMSFVAPARARDFISKFRMHDPEGRAFGDIFWAKIAVSGTDLACTLIEHTSFPDGSTLLPKQSFEKKWRVKTGAKA